WALPPRAQPQAPAPAAPAAPAPAPAAPAAEAQSVTSLPDWAQTLIHNTRAEAASWRVQAQQGAAQPQAPAPAPQAPPIVEGDVATLPQWAQQRITDATRQADTQAAVYRLAQQTGADPAALLHTPAAMAGIAAVDLADEAALTAAITAAVNAHPWIAARPGGPARSGADFTPGSGEVTAAQFAAMDYDARIALHTSDPDTYRRLAAGN
ncbi:hypothetical protein ACWCO9_19465, partial [Streptomyces sp. NPDC001937]